MAVVEVTALRVYPVKSLGGLAVDRAKVEPQGLAGDRRWCLVDEAGNVITARESPGLLRLTAEVADDRSIRVTDPADNASIVIGAPHDGPATRISLSRMPQARLADPDASAWISERVDRGLRLVWQQDPASRSVSAAHGGQPGDVLSMADTGPLLLVCESSLERLNQWICETTDDRDPTGGVESATPVGPLDVVRFRPNVVVDGDVPFAEDTWRQVQIGDVTFRTTELCDRCVMTTLDPVTLVGGKEPIRTLARHRRWDGATWFGIRLLPLSGGSVGRSDPVVPRA
ncbi:MAG: MOSC N-terminal beta barrel domain-containing protein [Ornithinimicrobium sp.]